MNTELEKRLEYAVEIAKQAGEVTLKYFGKLDPGQRRLKPDGTPVTIADQESETLLRELIAERYPDDAILGEEFDDKPGTSGFKWVIDPIDGTISFVQGVPLYGTMLACLQDDQPILGVIHMPALDETVWAADGLGCWHRQGTNPPVQGALTSTARPEDTLLVSTSLSYFTTPPLRALYEQLDSICRLSRGWSDCYGWVLLATGRVDAIIEPELSLWDFAAALPIIRELGGIWSDLEGNSTLEVKQILAANPKLQSTLLAFCEESLSSRSV